MAEFKQQTLTAGRYVHLLHYFLTLFTNINWIIVFLPLLYILGITFIPIMALFKLSVFDENGFTLKYLAEVVSSPLYLKVLILTLKIAFLVTVFSLIISYPVAYLIVQLKSPIWKKTILSIVLLSFWISVLVRTLSWTILLQDQGVINKFLIGIDLITKPLPLLYTDIGVVIGMTHILMPYMVLSLYSIMQGIDQHLTQAAEGLGANPSKAFRHIFLPLSFPGVVSGSLLVFVLSLGFYVTPALLGGAKNMMIAMLIQDNIINTLNWHLASALSLLLFVVTIFIILVPYVLYRKYFSVRDVS